MDETRGTGTTQSSGAPEFTPGLFGFSAFCFCFYCCNFLCLHTIQTLQFIYTTRQVSYDSVFSFMCSVL